MRKAAILALAVLALPAGALAVHEDQWLHVAVNDDTDGTVRVNLPLTTVAAVLPLIDTDGLHRGRVRIDDLDLDRTDVTKILKEVRKAKDGEYVTIHDGDSVVHVRKDGEFLRIQVEDRDGSGEQHVEVRIPVKVLDALTSGKEGELDLLAAIEVLSGFEGQDLVTVNDDGDSVRIWIDRSSSPEEE
jgi:hypothetical protein